MDRLQLSEQTLNLLYALGAAILAAYWIFSYIDAIRRWEDSVAWHETADSIERLPVTKEGEE